MVGFLLDVPEPLLPRPLLVVILSEGLVRILLPGVASFFFSIRFSTRVEVFLFLGNRVFVFSGLLCLLGHCIFLVSCSNSFSKCWLVTPRSCWPAQSLTSLREVGCPHGLTGLASLENWRYSCLCSELIPSVAERSTLFVKELSFPQTAPN